MQFMLMEARRRASLSQSVVRTGSAEFRSPVLASTSPEDTTSKSLVRKGSAEVRPQVWMASAVTDYLARGNGMPAAYNNSEQATECSYALQVAAACEPRMRQAASICSSTSTAPELCDVELCWSSADERGSTGSGDADMRDSRERSVSWLSSCQQEGGDGGSGCQAGNEVESPEMSKIGPTRNSTHLTLGALHTGGDQEQAGQGHREQQAASREAEAAAAKMAEGLVGVSGLVVDPPFHDRAMGSVAHGCRDGLHLAVKTVAVGKAGGRQLFDSEVAALSRLSHPHVIRCYGAEEAAGGQSAQLLLEWASGGSVAAALRRGDPRLGTLVKRARVALDTARAMEYVHAQGIVHRDLKCDNLLLMESRAAEEEGGSGVRVVVADFGLALEVAPGAVARLPEEAGRGTGAFRAPEVFQGVYNAETDIFALGYVLLELVIGWPGYDETLPLAFEDGEQRRAYARLCRMCMENESGRRPASMAVVVAELQGFVERFAGEEPVLLGPTGGEEDSGTSVSFSSVSTLDSAGVAAVLREVGEGATVTSWGESRSAASESSSRGVPEGLDTRSSATPSTSTSSTVTSFDMGGTFTTEGEQLAGAQKASVCLHVGVTNPRPSASAEFTSSLENVLAKQAVARPVGPNSRITPAPEVRREAKVLTTECAAACEKLDHEVTALSRLSSPHESRYYSSEEAEMLLEWASPSTVAPALSPGRGGGGCAQTMGTTNLAPPARGGSCGKRMVHEAGRPGPRRVDCERPTGAHAVGKRSGDLLGGIVRSAWEVHQRPKGPGNGQEETGHNRGRRVCKPVVDYASLGVRVCGGQSESLRLRRAACAPPQRDCASRTGRLAARPPWVGLGGTRPQVQAPKPLTALPVAGQARPRSLTSAASRRREKPPEQRASYRGSEEDHRGGSRATVEATDLRAGARSGSGRGPGRQCHKGQGNGEGSVSGSSGSCGRSGCVPKMAASRKQLAGGSTSREPLASPFQVGGSVGAWAATLRSNKARNVVCKGPKWRTP